MSVALASFKPDSGLVARVHPAHNHEERRGGVRPRLVVLHYTGMASAQSAIDWLVRADSGVSCHYVIDERGEIVQLVPEVLRAWHAGVSSWRGETDINSYSIGIEIHNPGHADGYPSFPRDQVAAVIALTRDICERHGIDQRDVVGHSDVAVSRKIDPGEKFPWARLARHGVGHWVRPFPVRADDGGLGLGATGREVAEASALLTGYGYELGRCDRIDDKMVKVLTAFQRHFRPRRVDGRLDVSTLKTLRRLAARPGVDGG
ncbi:MAG TPA: N-acetylmuramoyl-L-alanine amidase [Hyphomicrobium sp.]|nr:N-acetylmuramoyl-L-alanine amidase [Hyphomicrobium sp.]